MRLKKIHVFIITIILWLPFQKIYSQNIEGPQVKIKDHNGTSDTIHVDCDYNFYGNKSIQLTADYPVIKQSDEYIVSSIDYPSNIDFSKGTPVSTANSSGKSDDVFGQNPVDIGFNFCFYGNNYNKIVISDNGVVSFDLSLANKECPYYIAGTNPNSGLPKNSIFGVYHDMNNTIPSSVKVYREGVAPYRRLIINFDNLLQYGPERIYSSSQIILYETLNIIDIYVGDKNLNPNTPKDKRALLGLMNSTGSLGVSPSGRNTGEWEAHEEAWRFTPNGKSSMTIRWYLQNSASSFSTTNNTAISPNKVAVSPSSDTYYRVNVTYNGCNAFTISDTIYVKFSNDFPTANEITTKAFCVDNGASYTIDLKSYESEINSDTSLNFTYYRNSTLTNQISDSEVSSYSFSSNQTVYVKVLKSGVCYSISKINLKLNKRPVLVDKKQYIVCDVGNDNKENVNLNSLSHGLNSTMSYVFLDSTMKEISTSQASNYLVNVSGSSDGTQTFYLKAWNQSINDKDCYTLISFTIKLRKKIELQPSTEYICFVPEGQLVIVNLTDYVNKLVTNSSINPAPSSITWEFYENSGYTKKIINPGSYTLKLNKIIYVKALHSDFCGDTRTQLIIMAKIDCEGAEDPESIPSGPTPLICNAKNPQELDLATFLPNFLAGTSLSSKSVDIIGFYKNAACTQPLTLTGTPPQYIYSIIPPAVPLIYLKYKIKSTGNVGISSLNLYVSKYEKLDVSIFDICDVYNDGEERVNLKEYKDMLSGLYTYTGSGTTFGNDQYDTVIFFDNEADRNLFLSNDTHLKGMITESYIVLKASDNPKTIYPVVRFNRCSYAYNLQFNLVPIEEQKIGPYVICDFGNDNKEIVDIIKTIDEKKINPTDLNDLEKLLTSEQLADLTSSIHDLTGLKYYTTKEEAHLGSTATITDPTQFEISDPEQMSVYTKIDFKTQCSIIVEIKFQFTTAVTLPEYNNLEICDIDDDKKEDVDLSSIIVNTNGSVIRFYTTEEGANNNDTTSGIYIGQYVNSTTTIMYKVNALLSNSVIIYMRVDDGTSNCVKVVPIEIKLIPVPVVNEPKITVCDFENDGKEIINSSNIEKLIIEPLIKSNPKLDKSMTYEFFLTKENAEKGVEQKTEFEIMDSSTMWVKIKTANCAEIYQLIFSLTESPVIKNDVSIIICNNNTKNSNETTVNEVLNLYNYNSKFLSSPQNISDYTFTYYKEKAHAINNTSLITGSTIVTAFPSTYWVRVENKNGCFSVAPVVVNAYPELEISNTSILLCNEEKTVKVDLTEYPTRMIGSSYQISDFDITYHKTKTDAINGTLISITDNYEVSEGSVVWIKFINKTTGCFIIRKIEFAVSLIPKANVYFLDICDESDGFMDGNYVISNLDAYKTNIIIGETLSFINSEYNFTYYRTSADAQNKTSAESPVNFTIKHSELTHYPPNLPYYIIYIRIDKKDGTCPTITSISVEVKSKISIDNSEVELVSCEDSKGKAIVDLTTVSTQISSNPDVGFTYYQNELNARKNEKPILNPVSYEARVLETDGLYTKDEVFVRIRNVKKDSCNNNCGRFECDSIAKIKIKIYPYIKVENVTTEICEYGPEWEKTKINLWNFSKTMLASNGVPDPKRLEEMFAGMRIIFKDASGAEIEKVEDTSGEVSALLTSYEPPVGQASVAITVKFINKLTGCSNEGTITITQKVTPRPNLLSYTVCDEDLNSLYDDVLLKDLDELVIKDSNLYKITYYKTKEEALDVVNGVKGAIDKNTYFEIDFINPLYVRVLNATTGCVGINKVMFVKNETHVPVTKEVSLPIMCDGPENDSIEKFDLHNAEELIGTYSSSSFQFYLNEADAKEAYKNEVKGIFKNLTEPEISNYGNRDLYKENGILTVDEIFIRVKDENGVFCDNIAKVKLYVYPYIQAKDYLDVKVCEFTSDGKTESTVNLLKETDFMTDSINSTWYPKLLDDIDITYYESQVNAEKNIGFILETELSSYFVPVGTTKIWVRFQSKTTECYQIRKMIITKTEAPKIAPLEYLICDDNLDDVYEVLLSDMDAQVPQLSGKYIVSYYETLALAESDSNPISKAVSYSIPYEDFPKTLAVRLLNTDTGCVRTGTIKIVTNPKIKVTKEVELKACDVDNDGFTMFDLTLVADDISEESDISFTYYSTLKDAQNDQNPISNYTSYTNLVLNQDYVYVRVEENPVVNKRCPSLAIIKLVTYYPPAPSDDVVYVCPRSTITLDSGNDGYESIRWFFKGKLVGEGQYLYDVGEIGIYTVEVTKIINYSISCINTFQIEVQLLEEPVIIELQQGKDQITVIAKGPAPLEYSIDNVNWQKNNTFTNLQQGIYTFYVRSVSNGCEAVTSKGIIFGILNVITPNGDNYNDAWRLCGLDMFKGESSHIKIFDRSGKQVFEQTSNTCFIWDGKHLGRNLPTTSYWYVITIADGRQYTGWIMLRNYDESYR